MRMPPSGTSPSSTLSPERRPASMLPGADADGEARHQQADPQVARVQRLAAEQQQVHLKQRAQKPEVGNAQHGEPQRAILSRCLRARDRFGERIQPQTFGGAGGGHVAESSGWSRSRPPPRPASPVPFSRARPSMR